jgi:UDP-N-acetylglucosamine diphosphorylase/glucosamine-1-phosphate N-acetyltransferase
MEVVLFDDDVASDWLPFALTRPVGELLFGAHTFRERAALLFGSCTGHVTAPHLRGFDEPGAGTVLDARDLAASGPRVYLCSRAVVDWGARFDPGRPGSISVGGNVVGCYVPDTASPPPAFFARPAAYHVTQRDGSTVFEQRAEGGARGYDLPGNVLENVWELVVGNADQITRDVAAAGERGASGGAPLPEGVHVIGPAGRVRLGANVTIEPGVVLDVSSGPIWFSDHVTVRAFSRIEGPLFVGSGSTLLGGAFVALSVGPVCRVHGELEESVILGYSNKAHDGFIGHAYLGRWVNLGALTTNSDLKNNYGTIRLRTARGEVDTGQIKIGCLLGDHVKTGIGVMLNTGTVIGACSNVFGAVQPPKYVPPFRWGSGGELVDYDLARFLETAAVVMSRRRVPLTDAQRGVLIRAWERSQERVGVQAS